VVTAEIEEQVMSETRRKNFTDEFKAKVALEAIRGVKTVNQIGQELVCIQRKSVRGRSCCKKRRLVYLIQARSETVDPSASSERSIPRSGD